MLFLMFKDGNLDVKNEIFEGQKIIFYSNFPQFGEEFYHSGYQSKSFL